MKSHGVSFAIAVAVGAVGMVFFRNPPTDSGQWASWVQAVGAIGAIGGAYSIARAQQSAEVMRQKRAEAESELRTRREVANVAFDLIGFLSRNTAIRNNEFRKASYRFDKSEYAELLQRLTEVRKSHLSAAEINDVIEMRSCLVESGFLLRWPAHPSFLDDKDLDQLETYQRAVREISLRRDGDRRA